MRQAILDIINAAGAPVRHSAIENAGINPNTIKQAVDAGAIEAAHPGWYATPGLVPDAHRPYVWLALEHQLAVFSGDTAEWLLGRLDEEPATIRMTLPGVWLPDILTLLPVPHGNVRTSSATRDVVTRFMPPGSPETRPTNTLSVAGVTIRLRTDADGRLQPLAA